MPCRVHDLLSKLPDTAAGQFLGQCGHFLFDIGFYWLFFFDIWNSFTSWEQQKPPTNRWAAFAVLRLTMCQVVI